jgi:hypothetical protein
MSDGSVRQDREQRDERREPSQLTRRANLVVTCRASMLVCQN